MHLVDVCYAYLCILSLSMCIRLTATWSGLWLLKCLLFGHPYMWRISVATPKLLQAIQRVAVAVAVQLNVNKDVVITQGM